MLSGVHIACCCAQALPAWFEASRHCCFLYVASELVKSFGSADEATVQQLGERGAPAPAGPPPAPKKDPACIDCHMA